MSPQYFFFLLWIQSFLICKSAVVKSWISCPSFCLCKWVAGKNSAICRDVGLSRVPILSSEIQSVDLSNNFLNSLPPESFRSIGLVHLQKIFLKNCHIRDLDKHAFNGLKVLFELHLSENKIHEIHPNTFLGNPELRLFYIDRNPIKTLSNELFTNQRYLQMVDFSGCQISLIENRTFKNVSNLQYLFLNSNQLTNMQLSPVESLHKLKILELHDNPWQCNCHLRQLRDWIISRNLSHPIKCAEPNYLKGKLWNEIDRENFSCKPRVLYPQVGEDLVEASSDDVTLSCKVIGDPAPEVIWVHNFREIGNHSRSTSNEPKFLTHESSVENGTRWVNLTVLQVKPEEQGTFACVAKIPGYTAAERNITLTLSSFLFLDKQVELPLVLTFAFLVAVIVVLSIVLFYCCCVCRKLTPVDRTQRMSVSNTLSSNRNRSHQIAGDSEQEESLLTIVNPVQ